MNVLASRTDSKEAADPRRTRNVSGEEGHSALCLPPTVRAFTNRMVAESARTTKVSTSIMRTVTLIEVSAPRRQKKATGMVDTTTPQ